MRRVVRSLFVLGVVVGLAVLTAAADWPQWRGPSRDGKSTESGLLASWPEGGPPLAWKAEGLGTGFSSLAVVGDRIYTLGDFADGQYALALKRDDGSTVWKKRIGDTWNDKYLGPRSTPTVADGRVYVLGTDGELVCFGAKDGAVLWQKSLPDDFDGVVMKAGNTDWKFAESPLVDGKRVIVTPGSKKAALVALDAETGKEIWRTAIPDLGSKGVDGAGYSSVVVSDAAGVKQYVQLIGRGLIGVDAATGKLLWSYNKVANDVANIPTPIVDGDRVFASTAYGAGAALLEIRKEGEGLAAHEIYFLPADTFQNHHGGMILDGGYVYAGTGHNKGFPVAIDLATGKLAWGPIRNKGEGSAAVTFADGHLYLRYQNGLMVLADATPAEYKERGSFEIPGVSKPSWSHPVVSGGKLYLREQDTLYCYDVTGKA